jgi:DNA-directed RNA polymerase subunit RPC12/RpoP
VSAPAPGTASRGYPCTACGARVEYAPGSQVLRCPYCGHEQQIAAAARAVQEHAYTEIATLPGGPTGAGPGHVFVCQKCGAQTESDALSERCQFCGSPLVAEASQVARIAPEAVLPFELDTAGVRTALRGWVSSRWFAPARLKKVTEAESLRGTYLPHWTFDARTESDYRGQRGEHYWVTETYTETVDGRPQTRTRQVQRTRWYPASGRVRRGFDDILVPATGRVPQRQLDQLAPWPLGQAQPYQPDYLAGYQTLRYDVEPDAGLATAKERMAPEIREDCRRDIGGDEQQVHSVDTRYFDVTYKLMLLPVWIVAYLYAGRSWQVLVNARTAEVIGERPYSVPKIIAAAVAAALAITAIIVVIVLARGR